VALGLIDDLDSEIKSIECELRTLGAHHPYVSLLQSVPGVAWILGYTIASEIGDINRAKVARVEVARKLAEAIWHMFQTGSYFSPARSQCLSGRA